MIVGNVYLCLNSLHPMQKPKPSEAEEDHVCWFSTFCTKSVEYSQVVLMDEHKQAIESQQTDCPSCTDTEKTIYKELTFPVVQNKATQNATVGDEYGCITDVLTHVWLQYTTNNIFLVVLFSFSTVWHLVRLFYR